MTGSKVAKHMRPEQENASKSRRIDDDDDDDLSGDEQLVNINVTNYITFRLRLVK